MASRSGRRSSFRSLFSPRSRSASRTASEAALKRRRERRARRWRESFPRFSLSNWHSSAIVQTVCALFRTGAEATKAIQRATGSHYVGAGIGGRLLRIEGLEQRQMLDASAHSLAGGSFSQDWTSIGLITANDNWANVPSIIGYLGDSDAGSPTGVDPRTLVADAPVTVDAIANQSATSITNGGVAEFEIGNPTVALQGSGTSDAPYLVIHLNSTGMQNISIAYDVRDIDATTDNAVQQVALQYRVGASGTWSNVTGTNAYIADATTGPSLATLVTSVSATLPAAAENQSLVQLRVMTTNAAGNDEWSTLR